MPARPPAAAPDPPQPPPPGAASDEETASGTLDLVKSALGVQQPSVLGALAHLKDGLRKTIRANPSRMTADLSSLKAHELIAVTTWLEQTLMLQSHSPPSAAFEQQLISLSKTVDRNTTELEKMRTLVAARTTALNDEEDERLVAAELGLIPHNDNSAPASSTWATVARRRRAPPPKSPLEQRIPASECLLKKTGREDPAFTSLTPSAQVAKLRECVTASLALASADSDVQPADVSKIVRAIRPLPSGDIIICSLTPEHSATFKRHASAWLAHITPAYGIHTPSWGVVVHRMPTSFDPSSPDSVAGLRAENEDVIPPNPSITWLTRPSSTSTQDPAKKHSSIVIHLPSADLANRALQQGIAYDGRLLRAERVMRSPPQCWKCQKFGHVSL
ncbi:hypothetical protein OC844_006978, partial [Tilletia horrida]